VASNTKFYLRKQLPQQQQSGDLLAALPPAEQLARCGLDIPPFLRRVRLNLETKPEPKVESKTLQALAEAS
jgi:hypothetical protein